MTGSWNHNNYSGLNWFAMYFHILFPGADPGFQVRGDAHKKILGYFVWKIPILCQKIIFFPIAEGGAKFLGYFVWKITILRKKIIFFPILGGRVPGAPPPLDPPLHAYNISTHNSSTIIFLYILILVINNRKILQWQTYPCSKWICISRAILNEPTHIIFCFRVISLLSVNWYSAITKKSFYKLQIHVL